MAMETVVGLAIATGRILVLPPEQRMYLLAKDRGKVKTDFSFKDFFPFEELANDNDGLTMISMREFLEREWGNLRNKVTGQVEYPPGNVTDWNGKDVKVLKEWLRNVTQTPLWSPSKCMAVFPASEDHSDAVHLKEMHQQIMKQGFLRDEYIDDPVPVDATTMERMRENLSQRRELCLYDEQMRSELVVHFMCYHKMRVRMLVHFYAFLFFEDWRDDLWVKRCVIHSLKRVVFDRRKCMLLTFNGRNRPSLGLLPFFLAVVCCTCRFMRDHMRYIDELQCAAARIVEATRKRALEHDPASNGEFDTFHVRRGGTYWYQSFFEAVVDLFRMSGLIIYVYRSSNNRLSV